MFKSQYPFGFGSDNHSGVHPLIMQALVDARVGHMPSYGTDPLTQTAQEIFKETFGAHTESFFVFNGTAANVLSLRVLLDSYQSVICASTAHINVDECHAPELLAHCKLIPLETEDGKISVEGMQDKMIRLGDQHHSQPRVVSLTQPTELGTLYTLDELKKICGWAHTNGLLVHMDGARLVNAAESLGVTLKEMTSEVGIDVLSFGGTKNGCMFGEAVIFFRPELAKNFKYYRKQLMQLPSKSRFIAAQFIALFKDGLWRKNARHANEMARLIAAKAGNVPQVQITQKVQANAVFARIPREIVKPLREKFFFYVWNEKTFEVRWMTTFDTNESQVDVFISELEKLCASVARSL